VFVLACGVACLAAPLAGQVDQQRAAQYFKEARALCEREGGRLWGVSLCGPIVIGDPAMRTRATSEPAPAAAPPAALGFANAAADWGVLEAKEALLAADRRSIRVPGPVAVDGLTVRGPGWTLTLAPGWTVRAGARIGDMMVVREKGDAG
jgi:hypothetical protein